MTSDTHSPQSAELSPNLLEAVGLLKLFGRTVALGGVDFVAREGTIHSLIGENGAGKSTLGKVISGIIPPDGGQIRLAGSEVRFRSPRDALRHGITAITQEHTLVPALSAIENVFLGRESSRAGVRLTRRDAAAYRQLAERVGSRIDGKTLVQDLSLAQRQTVEVMRALARDAKLIVFDEPTAVLGRHESKALFDVMRQLRDAGRCVVFVSHFLDEILSVSDEITILRNGEVVRHVTAVANETETSLMTSMLGGALQSVFPARRRPTPDAPVVMRATGLTRHQVLDHVSLEVRAGEIVGIVGLVGSGRTETLRAIFGADRIDDGSIEMLRSGRRITSPRAAIRAGVALIPEQRREQGLIMDRSVGENVGLVTLTSRSRFGVIRKRAEDAVTAAAIEQVGVRGGDPHSGVSLLSGGNQQKALFARWMLHHPQVLLADEPTRGIDIGAKRAIYQLLVDIAADGTAVVLVSSELEEVLSLSHRVLVMSRGTLVGEFDPEHVSEEQVMATAFDIDPSTAPLPG